MGGGGLAVEAGMHIYSVFYKLFFHFWFHISIDGFSKMKSFSGAKARSAPVKL